MLTVEEAAVVLKVTPATVRELAREGKIPARRIGRLWRFDESELNQAGKVSECPSTATPRALIGGFASRSLVEKFASQRGQRTAKQRKNTNTASVIDIGERRDSMSSTAPGSQRRNGGSKSGPGNAA